MRQRGDGLGFAFEAGAPVGIIGERRRPYEIVSLIGAGRHGRGLSRDGCFSVPHSIARRAATKYLPHDMSRCSDLDWQIR